MNKIKKITMSLLLTVAIIFTTLILVACPQNNNYPVVGVWHATASWHEESPYNYNGYDYVLDVYIEFRDDGTIRNKRTLSINGNMLSDEFSDWVIVNATWSVSENVITLSSGKKYVIIDDEFNDTYPNPQIILHYKKDNTM